MKKRSLAVLCTAAAVAAGCVACGGAAQPKGQDSSQAVAEEKGKEKIKVTFIKNEWHGDPNDMEIYKILEEKTGVMGRQKESDLIQWRSSGCLLYECRQCQ